MPTEEVKRKRGVPDDVKIVRRTRRARMNANIRKGLMDLLLDWPVGEGKERLLDLLSERDQGLVQKRKNRGKRSTWKHQNPMSADEFLGGLQPKKSHLPQSQQLERGEKVAKSPGQSSPLPLEWQALKSLDIVAFNLGAERTFVQWLFAKAKQSEQVGVSIGWILSNAAYDLDISTATVKRYIVKFTADRAPFVSESGFIRLRASEEYPEEDDRAK